MQRDISAFDLNHQLALLVLTAVKRNHYYVALARIVAMIRVFGENASRYRALCLDFLPRATIGRPLRIASSTRPRV
jgi:hypothetical protein